MTTGFGCRLGLAVLFAAGALSLTAGDAPLAAQATTRTFDPVAFFTGRTVGTGTLKKALSRAQATRVVGNGTMRSDGVFVLDQSVDIEGDPHRNRQWRLRETGPGRYEGTISDAKGNVVATVTGNRMRVRYTLKDGFAVDQTLVAAADGRSVHDTMKLRKLGIVAATLDETIRKE
jgi:hypothetical protein